jgi:hypothetical protein
MGCRRRLWDRTVERARRLSPELLHESVGGEWSFIETLRHLVFATDSWIRRAILGDPSPWDPLDLPWDEMPDTPGMPRDRTYDRHSTRCLSCDVTGCRRCARSSRA